MLEAHTYPDFGRNPCDLPIEERPRELEKLRLLQLDLSVRDSQATETGWVFATFMYDGSNPSRQKWKRLIPVGVSWEMIRVHTMTSIGRVPSGIPL